jgi:hypothetical protein
LLRAGLVLLNQLFQKEGSMNVSSLVGSLLLVIASSSVYAGFNGRPVSEPGMLELLAIGAVAAIVVAIRQRRK